MQDASSGNIGRGIVGVAGVPPRSLAALGDPCGSQSTGLARPLLWRWQSLRSRARRDGYVVGFAVSSFPRILIPAAAGQSGLDDRKCGARNEPPPSRLGIQKIRSRLIKGPRAAAGGEWRRIGMGPRWPGRSTQQPSHRNAWWLRDIEGVRKTVLLVVMHGKTIAIWIDLDGDQRRDVGALCVRIPDGNG